MAAGAVPAEQKAAFTPRERKINRFSGQYHSQAVNEFVKDGDLTIKTRPTSDDDKVNFIISNLAGLAREEIRYRPALEKRNTKDVLAILKDMCG